MIALIATWGCGNCHAQPGSIDPVSLVTEIGAVLSFSLVVIFAWTRKER